MTTPTASDAVALLEDIRRLLELRGENPFKIRAYEKAAHALAGQDDLHDRARAGTLTELAGIGKGIAEVLTEFLLHGKTTARDELSAALPPGLLELTQVPGLGPKKAQMLIEELGIQSLSELEYACKENRLLKLKGFGPKLQQKISEGLQFLAQTRGQQRIDEAMEPARSALEVLRRAAGDGARVEESGPLRRRLEVLAALDYLCEVPVGPGGARMREKLEHAIEAWRSRSAGALPVRLHFSEAARFGYEWARTTATPEHWQALESPAAFDAATEEAFFSKLKLPVIPPESRETGEEVTLARSGKLAELLPEDGVQGVFHNHTDRSDGTATLEEMVLAARALGYKYLGISDHSQSAFYAQGLKVPTLLEQEKEIRDLQQKYSDIRIFWGIESDILADGSLDYEGSVLKRFDFVVASIHSRFQMDRETMTQRILEAIRNPYTRFLGHATGRLLLGRKGYEVDMEKVIAEAAACNVAIEINANPARLDIDWRWGPRLRECGTLVSVNPDAHETDGLRDTHFGVTVARKALLPRGLVVNSRSVREVDAWLARK